MDRPQPNRMRKLTLVAPFRKGNASKLAVPERREVETLVRERRSKATQITGVRDKLDQCIFEVESIGKEERALSERMSVRENKHKQAAQELAKLKREHADLQEEKTRIV